MGLLEEFGPGNPPHGGSVGKIIKRCAKIIVEGAAGLLGFGCFMFLTGLGDGGD